MKPTLLVVAGDLHINSTVALSPDEFTLDDGQVFTPAKPQKWINGHWKAFWQAAEERQKETGAEVVTILNGELADVNKHASTQYVTNHSGDAAGMAVKALEHARAISDRIYVTRGTEAHTGLSGGLDEAVARAIGATPDENYRYSRFHFRGVIGGLRVDVCHHTPSSFGRPWTKGADSNRVAQIVIDEYLRGGQALPHLAIRGHAHRPSDSYDNHAVRVIAMPSWQLKTSFAHRIGASWQPIGGLQLLIEDGMIEREWKHYHDWPLEDWSEA